MIAPAGFKPDVGTRGFNTEGLSHRLDRAIARKDQKTSSTVLKAVAALALVAGVYATYHYRNQLSMKGSEFLAFAAKFNFKDYIPTSLPSFNFFRGTNASAPVNATGK